jgi:hypothetical protein
MGLLIKDIGEDKSSVYYQREPRKLGVKVPPVTSAALLTFLSHHFADLDVLDTLGHVVKKVGDKLAPFYREGGAVVARSNKLFTPLSDITMSRNLHHHIGKKIIMDMRVSQAYSQSFVAFPNEESLPSDAMVVFAKPAWPLELHAIAHRVRPIKDALATIISEEYSLTLSELGHSPVMAEYPVSITPNTLFQVALGDYTQASGSEVKPFD